MATARGTVAGKVGAGLYVLAFSFGVIGSEDPLIRVACALSLLAFGLAHVFWARLSERSQSRLGLAVLLAMGLSFGFVMFGASRLGGSALNGRATGGQYYLAEHGVTTLVSKRAYYAVAAVETLLIVSWPLGFLIAAKGTRVETHAQQAVQQ
jgi:hypothetical protein